MYKLVLALIFILASHLSFAQVENIAPLPSSISIQSNSPIRDQPDHSGNLILRTDGITKALLLDRIGEYLEIKIDTLHAFVSYAFLVQDSDEIKQFAYNIRYESKVKAEEIKYSALKEKFRLEQLEQNEIFQEKLKQMIEKYGDTNGKKIAFGKVWIGMTEEMLLDSWGQPIETNRTAVNGMIKKQYVYPNHQYVYVENGKVTAWQD